VFSPPVSRRLRGVLPALVAPCFQLAGVTFDSSIRTLRPTRLHSGPPGLTW